MVSPAFCGSLSLSRRHGSLFLEIPLWTSWEMLCLSLENLLSPLSPSACLFLFVPRAYVLVPAGLCARAMYTLPLCVTSSPVVPKRALPLCAAYDVSTSRAKGVRTFDASTSRTGCVHGLWYMCLAHGGCVCYLSLLTLSSLSLSFCLASFLIFHSLETLLCLYFSF